MSVNSSSSKSGEGAVGSTPPSPHEHAAWFDDYDHRPSFYETLRQASLPKELELKLLAAHEREILRRLSDKLISEMPSDGRGWSDSEWWTIQHAVDVSGNSRRTISRWVESGRVRKWTISTRNVRVRAEDVLRASGHGCPIVSHRQRRFSDERDAA